MLHFISTIIIEIQWQAMSERGMSGVQLPCDWYGEGGQIMARSIYLLTANFVKDHKPVGIYSDGGGVRFQITLGGTRRWFIRVTEAGKRKDITLGTTKTLTLAEARDKAAAIRKAIADGTDPLKAVPLKAKPAPLHHPADADKRPTFREAWDAFWVDMKPQLIQRSQSQWESVMDRHVFPHISSIPVADVKASHIIAMLRPIWNSKEETARRVLMRVDSVFETAILNEWRDKASPCVGVARQLGIKRQSAGNFPALHYSGMPGFLARLRGSGGMASSRWALEFQMLTAVRSGDVRGAVWAEFDLAARTWTIPRERLKIKDKGKSKNEKRPDHVVPLSDPALAILEHVRAAYPGSALVFPGQKGQPLSDNTLSKRMRDMQIKATPHGGRSSFKDWAAENGVDDQVSEAALDHVVKGKTGAAYLRTRFIDQRVIVMDRWGKFCCGIEFGEDGRLLRDTPIL
jgi:integrase